MKQLLSGNKAVARGAYEAGVRVAAAYPGTPSTEILENLARYDKVYSEWSPNEKVALDVAIGAAYAGARAMTATSGSGFCLMVEGIGLAGITETPLVIIDA